MKKKNGRKRENLSEKIEVMVVGRNNECSHICIFLKENKQKQRYQFKYLVSSEWRNNINIAWKIAQAKIFFRIKSVLAKKDISIHTKKRAPPGQLILVYGCESWNYKTVTTETRCTITVISTETATNHMGYKEVKQKVLR